MAEKTLERRVDEVRRFNRFYTRRIGVLREGLLASPFSLTEVRVLYELAHRQQPTAVELARELGLDSGYLSRLLRGFARRGWLRRERSPRDGRRALLSLTARGRRAFAPLETRARKEVAAQLQTLSGAQQARLLDAMRGIEELMAAPHANAAPYVLRAPHPGDLGWVVERHGALYAGEYGYDVEFEGLVAEIVAHFVRHFDARRERCWIAERQGERLGCIFLVKKTATIAKLRLLLVEPAARGLGVGKRLVEECVRFARQAGYRKITLWTQSDLYAARHIYRRAGFRRVHEERHRSFGKNLVAETWDLDL